MTQSVAEFYAGQKILVTGGTGFMGKVLIEKLLRSCPDIDTIYVLIRSKKGKSIEERWAEVLALPVFDKLKSMRPKNLEKVRLLPGELSRENLGLSSEHKQELIENATLVFHVAADVQFSESLCDALIQNVKATKGMLDLAMQLKKLKGFIYLSTTYCNFNRPPNESIEEILPACQDWRTLLKLQETQPSVLYALQPKVLCGHPNSYTWSKSLAEQVVKDYSKNFPVAVIRPAIVVGCADDDPLLGWNDSIGGFSAVAIGAYFGVLRVMRWNSDNFNDLIPVDIVTKAQLIAGKKAVEQGGLEVYNCGSAAVRPVTYLELTIGAEMLDRKIPLAKKVWLTDIIFTTNPFFYNFCFFYRQLLPSIFLDLCLKIAGREGRFIKIAKKMANADRVFGKFASMKVAFPNKKFLSLENYLSRKDKKDFSVDITKYLENIYETCCNLSEGSLRYALKLDSSPQTIEKNRQWIEILKILNVIITGVQYGVCGILSLYLSKKVLERNGY